MGRPRKAAPVEGSGAMTVLKADAVHNSDGGFLKPGDKFDPVDEEARESLIAKGFAQ